MKSYLPIFMKNNRSLASVIKGVWGRFHPQSGKHLSNIALKRYSQKISSSSASSQSTSEVSDLAEVFFLNTKREKIGYNRSFGCCCSCCGLFSCFNREISPDNSLFSSVSWAISSVR